MGLATAQAFARSGAAVVLADIDQAALSSATKRLQPKVTGVIGVPCDVADAASLAAAVRATVEQFGRLDTAFNNTGIQVPQRMPTTNPPKPSTGSTP